MKPEERATAVLDLVIEALSKAGTQRIGCIRGAHAVLSAWATDEQVALGMSPHIPLVFPRDRPLTDEEMAMRRPTRKTPHGREKERASKGETDKWCPGAKEDHSMLVGSKSRAPPIATVDGADCKGCGRFIGWHRDKKRLRPHLKGEA